MTFFHFSRSRFLHTEELFLEFLSKHFCWQQILLVILHLKIFHHHSWCIFLLVIKFWKNHFFKFLHFKDIYLLPSVFHDVLLEVHIHLSLFLCNVIRHFSLAIFNVLNIFLTFRLGFLWRFIGLLIYRNLSFNNWIIFWLSFLQIYFPPWSTSPLWNSNYTYVSPFKNAQ